MLRTEYFRHTRALCRHSCRHTGVRVYNIRLFLPEYRRKRPHCLRVIGFILHLRHGKHRHPQLPHRFTEQAVRRKHDGNLEPSPVIISQIIQKPPSRAADIPVSQYVKYLYLFSLRHSFSPTLTAAMLIPMKHQNSRTIR